MKLRIGFVSNSSSSSFTLCVPKGTTKEEIRAIIEKQVGEMEGFFIPGFRQELVDTIIKCKGNKINIEFDLKFEQDYLNENPDSNTDERDRLQGLLDKKVDFYQGGFSDCGDGPMQSWLCDTNFEVNEENFSMKNIGGY